MQLNDPMLKGDTNWTFKMSIKLTLLQIHFLQIHDLQNLKFENLARKWYTLYELAYSIRLKYQVTVIQPETLFYKYLHNCNGNKMLTFKLV